MLSRNSCLGGPVIETLRLRIGPRLGPHFAQGNRYALGFQAAHQFRLQRRAMQPGGFGGDLHRHIWHLQGHFRDQLGIVARVPAMPLLRVAHMGVKGPCSDPEPGLGGGDHLGDSDRQCRGIDFGPAGTIRGQHDRRQNRQTAQVAIARSTATASLLTNSSI